jgi:hypothetical protein
MSKLECRRRPRSTPVDRRGLAGCADDAVVAAEANGRGAGVGLIARHSGHLASHAQPSEISGLGKHTRPTALAIAAPVGVALQPLSRRIALLRLPTDRAVVDLSNMAKPLG